MKNTVLSRLIFSGLALSLSFGMIRIHAMNMKEYTSSIEKAKQREAEAIPEISILDQDIASLKLEIESVKASQRQNWNQILTKLGATPSQYDSMVLALDTLGKDLPSSQELENADSTQITLKLTNQELASKSAKRNPVSHLPRFKTQIIELDKNLASLKSAWAQILANRIQAAKEALMAAKAPKKSVVANTNTNMLTPSNPNGPMRTYTVQKRAANTDCLWRIAQMVYGDKDQWEKIYNANKNAIAKPDSIEPGLVLIIPR